MKLTVLVDNNTYIDQYYLGEPAASYYIEEGDARILFDCGYSDAFMKNAESMGIDLSKLTHIVFSHGHDDHTGGLKYLKEKYDLSNVQIIAHPKAFFPKRDGDLPCGSPFTAEEIASFSKLNLSDFPVEVTDKLLFTGETHPNFDFESVGPLGERFVDGKWEADDCQDDAALVYEGKDGLFFITGCSHSGICNIMIQAFSTFETKDVTGVLGGLHLFDVDERLEKTIHFMDNYEVKDFYPCHCVSLQAKAKMMEVLNVHEVGVGLTIEVE